MSRIINTGICSYGMSGQLFHAPFLEANPHYNLAGIVERHKELSRERYPNSKLYRSCEELIEDRTIELVVINTPVQTHFDYAKAALLSGKNTIVEKPFTVNAAQAIELNELAKEKNIFLSVYQNRRYDGDYRAVKDVVAENLLGELKEVEIHYDRYRPEHSGKEHKEGDQPGAGNLHDLGAHLIDQALQLFGFPSAVFADIFAMRQDVVANDYFEVLLYYPRPFRVKLKGTVFAKETCYAYILQGENGTYMQQRSDTQEQQLTAGTHPSIESWISTPDGYDGLLHTIINGEEIKKPTRSEIGNYMVYYEEIYEAIINKKSNPIPAIQAVHTMKIIDAALLSAKEKKIIPVTE